MNTQQAAEQLFSQLSELCQSLAKLATTLQQEESALSQNDFAEIEKLAHDKELLSVQIEQLEQQRHGLCQQLNISGDFASIKTYLAGVSSRLVQRLEQQWDKIRSLGQQCANQNQVNGLLVAHQQRHTQQALAILRGVVGNEELYSASGSQQSAELQHSLGRV